MKTTTNQLKAMWTAIQGKLAATTGRDREAHLLARESVYREALSRGFTASGIFNNW